MAHRVFEERGGFRGRVRGSAGTPSRLIGLERRRLEKRDDFIQYRLIAALRHVAGGDVGQPEQIVGAARSGSASARRMPPVLHVPLDELPRRRAKEVLATEVRPRVHERKHVLQLIAKTEGPAGLVRAAARPDATAQRLIEQPAIDDEIERIVRRADLDGAEDLIPRALDRRECRLRLRDGGIARRQPHRVGPVAPLPEGEGHALGLAGLDLEDDLQGPAWVKPGARAPGEPLAEERSRRAQRAVASDELSAIAGVRSWVSPWFARTRRCRRIPRCTRCAPA